MKVTGLVNQVLFLCVCVWLTKTIEALPRPIAEVDCVRNLTARVDCPEASRSCSNTFMSNVRSFKSSSLCITHSERYFHFQRAKATTLPDDSVMCCNLLGFSTTTRPANPVRYLLMMRVRVLFNNDKARETGHTFVCYPDHRRFVLEQLHCKGILEGACVCQ
jgi:hypothetical protein